MPKLGNRAKWSKENDCMGGRHRMGSWSLTKIKREPTGLPWWFSRRIHRFRICAAEQLSPECTSCNYSAHASQLLKPTRPSAHALQKKPQPRAVVHSNREEPCLLQLEKSPHSNKCPAQPKINKLFFLKESLQRWWEGWKCWNIGYTHGQWSIKQLCWR